MATTAAATMAAVDSSLGVVAISLAAPDAGITGELSLDAAAVEPGQLDPLRRAADCRFVGTSGGGPLLVSIVDDGNTGGDLVAVNLVTNVPVDGPGVHAATLVATTADGRRVRADGNLVLAEGMAAGTFEMIAASGGPATGSFTCDPPVPTTAATATTAADSGAVVVSARLVGALTEAQVSARATSQTLATHRDAGAVEAAAWCTPISGSVGADAPYVVRLSQPAIDDAAGGLVAIELTSAAPVTAPGLVGATLALEVYGVRYEVADATLVVGDDLSDGTFSGTTAEGVTIDGAFAC